MLEIKLETASTRDPILINRHVVVCAKKLYFRHHLLKCPIRRIAYRLERIRIILTPIILVSAANRLVKALRIRWCLERNGLGRRAKVLIQFTLHLLFLNTVCAAATGKNLVHTILQLGI